MKGFHIDEKWCRDTGIVAAILLLLFGGDMSFVPSAAIIMLFATLVYPRILWPLGLLWKMIAEVLAFVVPKLFFGVVFVSIVLPVGLIRRALGADPLMLKSKRYESAFKKRDQTFGAKDLITPF